MNPFSILSLPTSTSKSEITRAFRKLALRCHPDKAGEGTTLLFQHINAAYEMLMSGDYKPGEKYSAPNACDGFRYENYTHAEWEEDMKRIFEDLKDRQKRSSERAEHQNKCQEENGSDLEEDDENEKCPVCNGVCELDAACREKAREDFGLFAAPANAETAHNTKFPKSVPRAPDSSPPEPAPRPRSPKPKPSNLSPLKKRVEAAELRMEEKGFSPSFTAEGSHATDDDISKRLSNMEDVLYGRGVWCFSRLFHASEMWQLARLEAIEEVLDSLDGHPFFEEFNIGQAGNTAGSNGKGDEEEEVINLFDPSKPSSSMEGEASDEHGDLVELSEPVTPTDEHPKPSAKGSKMAKASSKPRTYYPLPSWSITTTSPSSSPSPPTGLAKAPPLDLILRLANAEQQLEKLNLWVASATLLAARKATYMRLRAMEETLHAKGYWGLLQFNAANRRLDLQRMRAIEETLVELERGNKLAAEDTSALDELVSDWKAHQGWGFDSE